MKKFLRLAKVIVWYSIVRFNVPLDMF